MLELAIPHSRLHKPHLRRWQRLAHYCNRSEIHAVSTAGIDADCSCALANRGYSSRIAHSRHGRVCGFKIDLLRSARGVIYRIGIPDIEIALGIRLAVVAVDISFICLPVFAKADFNPVWIGQKTGGIFQIVAIAPQNLEFIAGRELRTHRTIRGCRAFAHIDTRGIHHAGVRSRHNRNAGFQIWHIVVNRDQEGFCRGQLPRALIGGIGVICLSGRPGDIGHILVRIVRVRRAGLNIKALEIDGILPFIDKPLCHVLRAAGDGPHGVRPGAAIGG